MCKKNQQDDTLLFFKTKKRIVYVEANFMQLTRKVACNLWPYAFAYIHEYGEWKNVNCNHRRMQEKDVSTNTSK